MPEKTATETIEAKRERLVAEAEAEVDRELDAFKAKMLAGHCQGGPEGPSFVNPDTLTEAEQKAVLEGLTKHKKKVPKVDPEEGLQDSVTVVLEHLRGDDEAAEKFKAAVGGD